MATAFSATAQIDANQGVPQMSGKGVAIMLRHTGPGKIRELLLPPSQSATAFQAVLYNFDIDGEMLKKEHTDWLKEHVLPQLSDPNLKIELRGETSNTGSDAYNLDLSRRRIAQVLNFFHTNGPVRANVSVSAVGDADASGRGEKKGVEDELLRAVIIKVVNSLHRLVPVVFDSDGSFLGFDPTANPPWVMLPFGSLPRIMKVENAEGLALISSNPAVASPQPALFRQLGPVRITQQTQRFRIVTGMVGDAIIRAVDRSGFAHALLAVSVLTRLTVKCAFHFVRNPRYGTQTRNPGDEANFLDSLNGVWGPQANIFAVGQRTDLTTMTDNLGDTIDTDAKFDLVVSHRDPSAQFNVFFVREIKLTTEDGFDDDADTTVGPPGDCICEDNTHDDRTVIAHELGHCLTLNHNSPIPTTLGMLMFPDAASRRTFLPRVHVMQARRAVRR